MKVLLIYCNRFEYNPTIKTLDDAEEVTEGEVFKDTQTAFIQVEEKDAYSDSN